jgi:integrating conjugative element protein (TIGR03757 family)
MCPYIEYAVARNRHQFLCPVLLTFALVTSADTLAADVQVFTDRHHPIEAPAGVPVVELDAPAHIELQLALDLPANPAQAIAIVQQRLTNGGAELQRRLVAAYQDLTVAWSLGITKIPAVVVDQRYVVYGEPNVSRALAHIEEYRRTHP